MKRKAIEKRNQKKRSKFRDEIILKCGFVFFSYLFEKKFLEQIIISVIFFRNWVVALLTSEPFRFVSRPSSESWNNFQI